MPDANRPSSGFLWKLCAALGMLFVLSICTWKVLEVNGAPQDARIIAAGVGALALMGAVLSFVVVIIRRVLRPMRAQQS